MHYHFETLDSTSKYAKENIKNLRTGDYVTCFFQTSGYGVTGLWEGKNKNFYLSIVIEEDDILNDKLSFCVMASIVRTLKKYTSEFNVKLPNDIFSNGKKLSGFIIEKVENKYIIGVGINVESSSDEFTYLNHINGVNLSVETLYESFVEEILKSLNSPLNAILSDIKEFVLIGEEIKYIDKLTEVEYVDILKDIDFDFIYFETNKIEINRFKQILI